jgi:hypothetical protein
VIIPMLTAAYWPDRPKLARPLKVAEYVADRALGYRRRQCAGRDDHPVQARADDPIALDPDPAGS